MSRPLFQVNELVTVVPSESNIKKGAYTGPAVVVRAEIDERRRGHCCNSPHVYQIDMGGHGGYCECILRKRPDPGSSFESIMDGLKEKVPA